MIFFSFLRLIIFSSLLYLTPDQLLRWCVPLLRWMHGLDVLLQVELDQVLLSAKVAVEHRACLPRDVHLDLLARAHREHRVDQRADPLVGGSDVELDRVHVEELRGAVFALVDVAALLLCLVLCLDVVLPAYLKWELLSTMGAEVFLLAAAVLAEFVLEIECQQ